MEAEKLPQKPILPPKEADLKSREGFRGRDTAGSGGGEIVEMEEVSEGVYEEAKIRKETTEKIQEMIKEYERIAKGEKPKNTFDIKV